MNFAKTIFAIFASVLLVGTQSVSAMSKKLPVETQACGCCLSQNASCCCVAPPSSVPQPVPVAPTRADSQNNFQIIATVVSLLLPSDNTPAQKIAFPPSTSLSLTSVPLYELNCSYLI